MILTDGARRDDEFFMREALTEASEAFARGEVPVGAVVVCRDRILGRGHNLCEALSDPTAHAEMQAITAACAALGGKSLAECTLYVTVEPCPMCAGAAWWSRLGRVVWGADDPKLGAMRFGRRVFHPRTELKSGVLTEECAALMRRFFEELRRRPAEKS